MKILVVNCGSSSLKYALIELPEYRVITSGNIEKLGAPEESFIGFKTLDGKKIELQHPVSNHTEGVELLVEVLTNPNYGFVSSLDEIEAIGHRLVHGGEKFASSVLIDDEVIAKLEECIPLAPLHNPANILGILAARKIFPNLPQVGVFDTAFHQTMPAEAYLYGLPYELYQQQGIRRYGFHGTSHAYVSAKAAELVGADYGQAKIITAHIGSGASIAAIKGGKSIDTSMGLTPTEGVIMGTRVGDIDCGILEFLLNKKDFDPEEIAPYIKSDERRGKATSLELEDLNLLLNKKSGLYGLAGIGSSDMRNLDKAAGEGNERARLAIDVFTYRIRKYIGSYAAALGGVDILVFTAGVGENRVALREEACQGLEFMGIKIDPARNEACRGKAGVISTDDSRVKVVVIPTDEEYMIAKDTYDIVHS